MKPVLGIISLEPQCCEPSARGSCATFVLPWVTLGMKRPCLPSNGPPVIRNPLLPSMPIGQFNRFTCEMPVVWSTKADSIRHSPHSFSSLRGRYNTGMNNHVTQKHHNGLSQNNTSLRHKFRCCAQWSANAMGSPWSFIVAAALVVAWAVTGPLFQYSDTWQLAINTSTTIVTFLMVFLIQNTQNRDSKALHLKLDELLRGVKGARTSLVNLESLSDEELDQLQKEFERLRGKLQKRENNIDPATGLAG